MEYAEKISITNNVWTYDQVLDFQFEVQDTTQKYDLILSVNHDFEFAHQNFYAKFITTYPSMKKIEDVVSIELGNNFGKWMGDCNSSTCAIDILLQEKTYFKDQGKHQISIVQNNRIDSLNGINSIEFKLLKVE